mmetsp:Transcript_9430/g.35030  ORF Transcript_9430/g.35030 Transcript_9430/m.35030 type:complete len:765 (-) Transcript_9430:1323-3617(-)|eukprot:CAMPEP_0117447700 /NCGR_PEP_ID=MMETSP0759-20121206/7014_1 /TAXON_ID=63605 /ORGANISM="Percolomonas cosmopolitus, Strain WS" /LENGTH=764 /DNA_ID=CAMNT_0005240051 /DNA_START=793 /DNA_END=3087 /DNA_ORIENTATION=-
MGLSESTLHSTFKHLDKNHSGTLSMEELLSEAGDPNTPIPYMCSLLALYHFDTAKKGALNYAEFKRMYHYIQKILKQSTRKSSLNRGKNVMSQFAKKMAQNKETSGYMSDHSHGSSADHHSESDHEGNHHDETPKCNGPGLHVSTSVSSLTSTGSASSMGSDRRKSDSLHNGHQYHNGLSGVESSHHDSSLHHIDSQSTMSSRTASFSESSPESPPLESVGSPAKHSTSWITIKTNNSNHGAPKLVCHSPHIPHYESSSVSQESQHNVQQWFQKLMKWKNFYDSEERLRFLKWLYKACDMDMSGKINMHELECFLITAEKDGVDLTSLLFDQNDMPENERREKRDISFHDFIGIIMGQYDIGKHGYLDKDEFFTLGNLVLSCYQSFERMSHYSNMTVGEWKLRYTLGEGAYGIVKFATHTLHMNQFCAIKIIKQGNVSDMSKLDCEIQCLQMLDHPNIVKLFDVDSDDEHIYLLMELCGGGNLFQHLEEDAFEESLARFYFNQLISGLSYCQSNGVCHRDLRLENLLLDNMGNLKISDFGAARIFKKGWDIFSTQLVGSIYHLSPEQINGKVYSGSKVDVWSCGVILFSFLTAELPFCSEDVREIFEQIRNADYTYPEQIALSNEAKDLIKRMLTVDPNKRITVEEILKHPWLKGPQQRPKLTQHVMEFHSKMPMSKFDKLFSSVLSMHDTFSLSQPIDDSTQTMKCINAAKYLKFSSNIVATEKNGIIRVESKLVGGQSNHFQKILHKTQRSLAKRLKQLKSR